MPFAWADFKTFIWNSKERSFLGRTGRCWAEIGAFFVVFYAFLFSYFCGMLSFFYQTVSHIQPSLIGKDSFLQTPGLAMRPRLKRSSFKDYTTLIYFTPDSNDKHTKAAVKDLEEALKPYKEAEAVGADSYWKKCSGQDTANKTRACYVTYTELARPGHCHDNDGFGFADGRPCVLVRLNKIYGWKPNPYVKSDQNLPNYVHDHLTTASAGFDLVWLQCEGQTEDDQRNLGQDVKYFPQRGFPSSFYPYLNQPLYLQPPVFVKFNSLKPNVAIQVVCMVYDKNIHVDEKVWEGSFHFELFFHDKTSAP